MNLEIAVPGAAFFATIIGIYLIAPLTRKFGLTDVPGGRKQHQGVIPLAGGIVIFIVMLCTAFLILPITIELMFFLIAAGLIVFTGALDDRYQISYRLRFVAQLIASLIVIYGVGNSLTSFGNLLGLGEIWLGYFSVPLTVLGFLTLINAFNMLDGLDGLAAGVSLVAFLGLYYLSGGLVSDSTQLIVLLFIGSLFAYQIFNLGFFPRHLPKVFLGDAGSTLLGFVICAFLIRYSQGAKAIFSPVVALWLVAVPLMDMVSTLLRRLRHGKSPFRPDSTHIHHIFMRAGFTRPWTLTIILIFSGLLAFLGILLEELQVPGWISFYFFVVVSIGYSMIIGRAWKLAKWLKRRKLSKLFLTSS